MSFLLPWGSLATTTRHVRSDRVAVAGGYAELASAFAAVINVSRTGVLIRTAHQHQPGDERPLILEFGKTPIRVVCRVVRCDAITARRGTRPIYSLGMTFVDPSAEAQSLLDRVCRTPPTKRAPRRRFSISFARRCPACKSYAVVKEARRRYACSSCDHHFSGVRIGVVRFAR